MLEYFLYYLIIINILTFIIYGIDKEKAKKGQWRIPESILLLLAVVGGSFGAWFGMRKFHHKTRKPKFYISVPLIFIVQVIVICTVMRKFYYIKRRNHGNPGSGNQHGD